MLIIVPTPIGNLKDITLRALEVLKDVDGIICEDSRRTGLLLHHFQIKKLLYVLNDFNEKPKEKFNNGELAYSKTILNLLNKLKSGQNLALVSDAGTPLIADPGLELVRLCLKEGVLVDSLPGPCSIIVALTLSGLLPYHFTFLHYLPKKKGDRMKVLKTIDYIRRKFNSTYIILVPPHQLVETIFDLEEVFGNMPVVIASELTKIHQRVHEKFISEWAKEFLDKGFIDKTPLGEYIVLFTVGHK